MSETNRVDIIEKDLAVFIKTTVPESIERQSGEVSRNLRRAYETFDIEKVKEHKRETKLVEKASRHIKNTAQRFEDENALMSSAFANVEDDVVQHEVRSSRMYLLRNDKALNEIIELNDISTTEQAPDTLARSTNQSQRYSPDPQPTVRSEPDNMVGIATQGIMPSQLTSPHHSHLPGNLTSKTLHTDTPPGYRCHWPYRKLGDRWMASTLTQRILESNRLIHGRREGILQGYSAPPLHYSDRFHLQRNRSQTNIPKSGRPHRGPILQRRELPNHRIC